MSLLIKEVQVVDGLGGEPYKADILVQKNIISAIGSLKARKTDRVIDGLGNYASPGFIDVHNSSDHYLSLFSNPAQESFIKQGITTIIGGHCGSSLAPLLYGELTSIRKWADPRDVNVDWHTVSEFLRALERISVGLNFGTLAGHTTIRRALIGERTRLLQRELDVFEGVLRHAMKDGAFGMSSGLGYVHGKTASHKEMQELIGVVKEFGGVYTVHLRNEADKILESVKEVASVTNGSGVRTVISHFRPIKGFEKNFEDALEYISDTENLYFDLYPYDISVRPLYTFLPEWAQIENIEKMLERVRDKKTIDLITKELKGLPARDIIIAGVPHHEYLVGKSIEDVAKSLGLTAEEAFVHVMDATDLRAIVFYKDVNEKLLRKALAHDKAFVTTHGKGVLPGEYMTHERSEGSIPKYLDIVLGGKILQVEKAVEKITSKPALFFGVKNRGVIKEGHIADIVLLSRNDYKVKEVVIGGKVFGREATKGEMLRHGK